MWQIPSAAPVSLDLDRVADLAGHIGEPRDQALVAEPVISATAACSGTGTAGAGSSPTWSCANTLASRHPVRGLVSGSAPASRQACS